MPATNCCLLAPKDNDMILPSYLLYFELTLRYRYFHIKLPHEPALSEKYEREKNVQLKIVGEKLHRENHTEPTSPKYSIAKLIPV